jgi:hypothetical protein
MRAGRWARTMDSKSALAITRSLTASHIAGPRRVS